MTVSTEPNAFMADVQADVASMFVDHAITVLYRKAGGSDFGEVQAVIGPATLTRTVGGNQRFGSGGSGSSRPAMMHGQATTGMHRVILKAKVTGEIVISGTGVTVSGGIEQLRRGDTLKVPAFAVGGNGSTLIELIVGANIECVQAAYWKGDLA